MMDLDALRPNPSPRIVALLDFALEEIVARLSRKGEYAEWLAWADSWKNGKRSPQGCVTIAHKCFEHSDDPVMHCLGQLAWGAKEACYSTPKSGWLVVRYVADAMVAFGVAFPEQKMELLISPTLDGEATTIAGQISHS